MSVSPAVMPQAAKPLWPAAIAGEPISAAPAMPHSGVRSCARYQCGGSAGSRWGSLASSGRPERSVAAADCPVVGAAAQTRELGESGQVGAEAVSGRTGVDAGWQRYGMVFGVGGVEVAQRLGAIGQQQLEPRQLDVPVADHEERHHLADADHVRRLPGRRTAAQQGELVRRALQTRFLSGVDAAHESLNLGPHLVVEHRQLPLRGLEQAYPAREAVERQRLPADQRRKGAAHQPLPQLQLEGAVLPLAEAEAEPGVFVIARFDVGDAVLVAADGQAAR